MASFRFVAREFTVKFVVRFDALPTGSARCYEFVSVLRVEVLLLL